MRNTVSDVNKQGEMKSGREKPTDDRALDKQLRGNDRLPEDDGVLEPVHTSVFCELLVKARNWREEQNCVDIVEIGQPCGTLWGATDELCRAFPADGK